MTAYHFSYPIEVRYCDLDPQGHVNNAHFLSYFEQARINYLINLGLLGRESSFLDMGIILADAHVTYLAPVLFGMDVRVDVAITKLGNKSLTMEYLMFDNAAEKQLASCSTVMVTYDYRQQASVPVPAAWREKIGVFENLP